MSTTTNNPALPQGIALPRGIASINWSPVGHNSDGFGNAHSPVTGYIIKYGLAGDPVLIKSIQVIIQEDGDLKLNSNLDPLSPGTGVPYSQSVLERFQEVYYAGNA